MSTDQGTFLLLSLLWNALSPVLASTCILPPTYRYGSRGASRGASSTCLLRYLTLTPLAILAVHLRGSQNCSQYCSYYVYIVANFGSAFWPLLRRRLIKSQRLGDPLEQC